MEAERAGVEVGVDVGIKTQGDVAVEDLAMAKVLEKVRVQAGQDD